MQSETMGSQPNIESLARQGSLYNLTLDEVQNQLGNLGKPLGSMNLDELLKSVWSAEANQTTSMASDSAGSTVHRQGSLTLSRDLSNKTVEEVWRDIQQKKNCNDHQRPAQERQATFGEMTLEDFLVKAGVVTESDQGQNNASALLGVDQNIPQHAQWMHYQLPSAVQQRQHQQNMMAVFATGHPIQQPLPVSPNPIIDAAYSEAQMNMSPPSLMGALSDTQTPGRKRVAPADVVEKNVERRQKRMIKNRESAARSRARKQAYTHELENKISRLEEENERLRKQQDVEKVLSAAPPPEPKYQLRRTSSSPF